MQPILPVRLRGALLASAGLLFAAGTWAGTLTVTQLGDRGPGSLRQAVELANANPGPDTIRFALSGTVILASPLTVTDDLSIDGRGQRVAISGGGQTALLILTESERTLEIARLTLRQANASHSAGGAILARGHLRLTEALLQDNMAPMGGAVYSSGGTLDIVNVTFAGNRALSWGGAVAVGPGTQARITHATFVGNDAAQFGGTLFQNPVYDTSVNKGSMVVRNSVIAGSAVQGNCSAISNRIVDGGGNLNTDGSCPFTAAQGSANFTDPLLGELDWHGGPTMTFAPLPGSPAIDTALAANAAPAATSAVTPAAMAGSLPAGPLPAGPVTDQRGTGYARVQGTAADRGAVEVQAAERTAAQAAAVVAPPRPN